ncbi:MAG: hypothetical protein A2Y79_11020 [Deltaproteobacteria bacterium RBG_13_43_22]|nr:MAG: hypothetical protein A2Y79_11020 [Deltaproteobacteria bacterium RBG_13_43_22]
MLKRMHCQMDITLAITPIDPILIKSSYASVSGSQMPFVRINRGKTFDEVYIPGSSLKGVIRSHAEKICRTLKDQSVCLPYGDEGEEEFCGSRFKRIENSNNLKIVNEKAYNLSCPACRTFGSTYFIGRTSISDAYADPAPFTETRDGVAIDRRTGGAAKGSGGGAKFDYEVVTHGTFRTDITLRNFEFWQWALLAFVLRDFKDELIRIGSGKSRGLGRIQGIIEKCTLAYYDRESSLRDLKDFCTPSEITAYGLSDFNPTDPPPLPDSETHGLRSVYNLTDSWGGLCQIISPALASYLENFDWLGKFKAFEEESRGNFEG